MADSTARARTLSQRISQLNPSLRKKASRALIQAAFVGDVEKMRLQYNKGAEIAYRSQKEPPDNNGMTALHAAAKGGHYRAVKFLVQHEANVNVLMTNEFTPLHHAAAAQHTEVVRYLIAHGANVNAQNSQGQTPLFKSDGDITRLLLGARADPNIEDNDGNTLLHCAAYDGHVGAIRLLEKAHINIRNREGQTALWLVCDRISDYNLEKSLEITEILLQRKADPNINCRQLRTPLQLSIQKNQPRLVGCLLTAGADARFRTTYGDTLLHLAASFQSATIVHQLLPQYLDVDTPSQPGNSTSLHTAIKQGSLDCVQALVDAGASVHVRDCNCAAALHIAAAAAASAEEVDIIKVLIDHGADVHALDLHHRTPLYYALHSPATAACLLDAGALLRATDEAKNTPLHHLALEATPTVVQVLLVRGASVAAVNKAGRTPLEELCANEKAWGAVPADFAGLSLCTALSSRSLEMFHLLRKHQAQVTPACVDSIDSWHNMELRNKMKKQLPWESLVMAQTNAALTNITAGLDRASPGAVIAAGGAYLLFNHLIGR
ncbi:Ankyrin-2 [Ptychographa xylographoides]|nr:Ankyrin-2 [Ptychographa xylographoides]